MVRPHPGSPVAPQDKPQRDRRPETGACRQIGRLHAWRRRSRFSAQVSVLIVPSNVAARIQEMHITLGHILCGAVQMELSLV